MNQPPRGFRGSRFFGTKSRRQVSKPDSNAEPSAPVPGNVRGCSTRPSKLIEDNALICRDLKSIQGRLWEGGENSSGNIVQAASIEYPRRDSGSYRSPPTPQGTTH